MTLLDLLHRDTGGRIHGVVVGLVTNNQDPDKLGRVRVKFPWAGDDCNAETRLTQRAKTPIQYQARLCAGDANHNLAPLGR